MQSIRQGEQREASEGPAESDEFKAVEEGVETKGDDVKMEHLRKVVDFRRKLSETSDEAVILCMVAGVNKEMTELVELAEQLIKDAERRLEYLSKISPENIYKHL